jgi:hypothetical protein
MDDFDRFQLWANKPLNSRKKIPADLHHAITSLPRDTWRDRAKVNEAVRKIRKSDDGKTAPHRPKSRQSGPARD